MTTGSERRRRTRVSRYLGEIQVRSPDFGPVKRPCLNLSLKGILVSTSDRVPVGSRCTVVFPTGAQADAAGVTIEGEVARITPLGIAIDFIEMEPESFLFLHRLVELHSDNPDRITEELMEPIQDEEEPVVKES